MDAKQTHYYGHHVKAHNLHEYSEEFNHLIHEKRFWELAGLSLLVSTAVTLIVALSDPYSLEMMVRAYGF